jgi:hypothetical protein
MNLSFGDIVQVVGIIASGLLAITIYMLQQRLSDKQKVDHRLEVERTAGGKLEEMKTKGHPSKIVLYNAKLLNKKYFADNKRSVVWGHPYHSAGFYSIAFDGLEFETSIEEWKGKKYRKVGLIPFERILGIKIDGDGSFNGMIIYVKPRLIQKDKYAIAYTSFRYYSLDGYYDDAKRKPVKKILSDLIKHTFYSLRYNLHYRWRFLYLNRKNGLRNK